MFRDDVLSRKNRMSSKCPRVEWVVGQRLDHQDVLDRLCLLARHQLELSLQHADDNDPWVVGAFAPRAVETSAGRLDQPAQRAVLPSQLVPQPEVDKVQFLRQVARMVVGGGELLAPALDVGWLAVLASGVDAGGA